MAPNQTETDGPRSLHPVVGPLVARWEHMAKLREVRAIEDRTKGDIDMALCAENAAAAYRRCASELALAGGGLPIPAPGERWD